MYLAMVLIHVQGRHLNVDLYLRVLRQREWFEEAQDPVLLNCGYRFTHRSSRSIDNHQEIVLDAYHGLIASRRLAHAVASSGTAVIRCAKRAKSAVLWVSK